jgi:hypothetical protein
MIIIYSVRRTHKTQFYTGGGGGVLYLVIQFSCRYTKLGYHILPPSTSILNKKGYKIYFCLSYLKLFCVLPSFAYLFYSHVEEELLLLDRASLECSCTLHNHSTVMADDSSNDRHLSPKLVETVSLNPFEIAQHINFKQIVLKAFKTARKI